MSPALVSPSSEADRAHGRRCSLWKGTRHPMVRAGFLYIAGVVVIGCGGVGSDGRESVGSIRQADMLAPKRPNVGINFVGGGPNGTPQPLGATEIAGAIPYQHWKSEVGASGFDFTVNTSDGAFAQIGVLWESA